MTLDIAYLYCTKLTDEEKLKIDRRVERDRKKFKFIFLSVAIFISEGESINDDAFEPLGVPIEKLANDPWFGAHGFSQPAPGRRPNQNSPANPVFSNSGTSKPARAPSGFRSPAKTAKNQGLNGGATSVNNNSGSNGSGSGNQENNSKQTNPTKKSSKECQDRSYQDQKKKKKNLNLEKLVKKQQLKHTKILF